MIENAYPIPAHFGEGVFGGDNPLDVVRYVESPIKYIHGRKRVLA